MMTHASKYFTLKWVVECKPGVQPFFETIAAFNSDRIAKHYADDCSAENRSYAYRVMQRFSNGQWKVIYEPVYSR